MFHGPLLSLRKKIFRVARDDVDVVSANYFLPRVELTTKLNCELRDKLDPLSDHSPSLHCFFCSSCCCWPLKMNAAAADETDLLLDCDFVSCFGHRDGQQIRCISCLVCYD